MSKYTRSSSSRISCARAAGVSTTPTVHSTSAFSATPQAFRAALKEFEQRQAAIAERPDAYLNLGVLHSNLGRPADAEASYLKALRMDPAYLPARFNLANLYNAQGRNEEAEAQLRAVLKHAPNHGEAYYSLGLLLAERGDKEAAAEYLASAARRMPKRARVRYNQALVLQELGRMPQAEQALLAAARLDGLDPDVLNALALLYARQQKWKQALPHAERLARLMPANAGAQRLLEQIRQRIGR